MVLMIIFFALFAICLGFSIFNSIRFVKNPLVEVDYRKCITTTGIVTILGVISFIVASFGVYMTLSITPDAFHVVQLVIGAILLSGGLFSGINFFIVHYYGKNIPEALDKWLFRIQLIGFIAAVLGFFIHTNGLSLPDSIYPVPNGISFTQGLVTIKTGKPNIAFYAICILSGAVLVYFICDHYMYKEYGEHGILESTFFIAFPAGILGARIWYVVGNWAKEFDYGRAMVDLNGMKIWAPLAIWNGGLTILGGAIMGIVVGVAWYLWKNKGKSIWIAVDMIVPCILVAQAIGRWGNYFNCEVHGLASNIEYWRWLPEIVLKNAQYTSSGSPDLVGTDQIYVPLFFIEFITNLLGYFVLAHVFGKALRKYTELGDLCFGYIIWYGATRVLMEPLRDKEFQMGEDGYWSWVWSMVFVLAGALLIVINHLVRYLKRKKDGTFKVHSYDRLLGFISTGAILVISATLIIFGVTMMSTNPFTLSVDYSGFNVGLMLLILGISVLLTSGISIPILVESFRQYE